MIFNIYNLWIVEASNDYGVYKTNMKNCEIDISTTRNMAESIQSDMEEIDTINRFMEREHLENENMKMEYFEKTSQNVSNIIDYLEKVVTNQDEYIKLLKKQLENSEKQLVILQSIFESDVCGNDIEREIMTLIRNQINDKHPLWDYVKDKGGDIAVSGITSSVPIIYKAFKTLLQQKGIVLP